MNRRSTPWQALMSAVFVAALALSAPAGTVPSLNTFSPGDVADANAVNANFSSLRNAVNDNDTRIVQVESVTGTRTMQFPARTLAYDPTTPNIGPHAHGLNFAAAVGAATPAVLYCRKPDDYAGGDATVKLTFVPTTTHSDVVDFTLTSATYDCGAVNPGGVVDVDAPGVPVAGMALYCQDFTIPASQLSRAIWCTFVKNDGAERTYGWEVTLLSVDWTYSAN